MTHLSDLNALCHYISMETPTKKLKMTLVLATPKICACGKTHSVAPKGSIVKDTGDAADGIYLKCCGSTPFIRKSSLNGLALEAA